MALLWDCSTQAAEMRWSTVLTHACCLLSCLFSREPLPQVQSITAKKAIHFVSGLPDHGMMPLLFRVDYLSWRHPHRYTWKYPFLFIAYVTLNLVKLMIHHEYFLLRRRSWSGHPGIWMVNPSPEPMLFILWFSILESNQGFTYTTGVLSLTYAPYPTTPLFWR